MEELLTQVKDLSPDDRLVFFQRFAENMTLGELTKLIPQLEDAWDVEAKPQMPDWLGKVRDTPEEEEVEQTEFDVVVMDTGAKRIQVVKAVRKATDMQLKDANTLLKELPATVSQKQSKDKAEEMKKIIEEAGGKVEIK